MRALVLAAGVGLLVQTQAMAQVTVGANFNAGSLGNSGFIPPDTMGAVGVDHYVELINGRYSAFRKADGVNVQTSSLNTFFSNNGVTTSNSFDPRVLYDPYSKRWFACAADNSSSAASSFLVAVSNSADPTAGWKSFRIDADASNVNWIDFPMLGLNGQSVVVTGNMFPIGAGSQAIDTLHIPKADLLLAVPTVVNRTLFQNTNPNNTGFAPQPAHDLDNGNLPLPLLSDFNTPAGTIKRSSVGGTPAAPTLDIAGGFIAVAAFNVPPTADQPGAKANIHTGDNRFQVSPVLNNGEIWGVQSVSSGGRAAFRWYRINAATNVLIESGTIADATLNLMRPSLSVNDFGDVVVGFSATSPAQNVSTYFVTGKTTAGVTTFAAPTLTQAGVSDYQRLDGVGRNRWGDYSATSTDPADPAIFWTIQEFVGATDSWSHRVSEIIIPQTGEKRWRNNLNGNFGTGVNWIGGAAPGAADHVVYSRPTFGTAGYTVTNPAGTTTNNRLSLRQGSMSLNLNGGNQILTNAAAATPGVTIGEFAGTPTMVISNGVLTSVFASIGHGSLSTATVSINGAKWNNSDGFAVAGRPPGGGGFGQAGGIATLNISSGELNVGGSLKVWNNGTLNWTGGLVTAGTLDVQGGRFLENANGSRLLRVGAVTTSAGGIIDLNDNDMQVQGNSTYVQVRNQIASARNGGAWNGTVGITSSAAAGNALHNTTLGAITGAQFSSVNPPGATFDGSPVAANDVLVKYTYYGDTDLNGIVDFDDYSRTDNGFNNNATDWFRGDFDYNGIVDFDDYSLIDGAFNTQSGTLRFATSWLEGGGVGPIGMDAPALEMVQKHFAQFGAPYAASFLAAVPEPSAVLGAVFSMLMMAPQRRRRSGYRVSC
ncbi:MAG: hypothetical protein H7Z14_21840 [Anaerolineae bacterium]|nr:hypothetical protein [Phycisphaerae bacterium]